MPANMHAAVNLPLPAALCMGCCCVLISSGTATCFLGIWLATPRLLDAEATARARHYEPESGAAEVQCVVRSEYLQLLTNTRTCGASTDLLLKFSCQNLVSVFLLKHCTHPHSKPPTGTSNSAMQDSRSLADLAEEFEKMLQSLQATFSTSATIHRDSSPASADAGEPAPSAAVRCLAQAATTAASHTEALCKGMHSVLVQMERQPRHGAAAASLRASLSAALAECSRLDSSCGCASHA